NFFCMPLYALHDFCSRRIVPKVADPMPTVWTILEEDSMSKAILDIAICFQEAIEAIGAANLSIGFRRFPKGSCADAALLLGTYIRRLGLAEPKLISGRRGDHTHAWLELDDGLVIDITANQFEDFD